VERLAGLLAGEAPLDLVRDVPATLDGDLGDAGQVIERDHVADRVDLGWPGACSPG
jgi:hypothetical protein